jgi:outer membrane receptor protein involved in Fe transport
MRGGTLGCWLLALAAGGLPLAAAADEPRVESQAESNEARLLELGETLANETDIASGHVERVEETPGVVTVINRDEIINSGARDLIDVLQLVPGFSGVGVDVEGVTDFGFRGIWAHEGKILFMIDGEPMNELLFDDNEFGHHYPIEQIERIEIIRGAGSVLYGGWAELAVINVVTRNGKQLDGAAASVYYGQMTRGLGQADLNLAVGKADIAGVKGLEFDAALFWGQGNRSDQTYLDFYGNSYSMLGNSSLDPFNVNAALDYQDLHLRFIYDHYQLTEADSYGQTDGCGVPSLVTGQPLSCPYPVDEYFITTIADAYYDIKLGDHVTLTPRFTYKSSKSWYVTDPNVYEYSPVDAERFTALLTLRWDILPTLNLLAGTEDYYEDANLETPGPLGATSSYFGTQLGEQLFGVNYYNLAGFAELQWRSLIGSLTAGARYEHNQEYGDSFVPRAALTKTIGRLHFKLLYSFAFRAPGIEDINQAEPGEPIQPERTQDGEVEVGYQFTDQLSASANVFYTVIKDPIVFYAQGAFEGYANFPQTGTEGVEAEVRLKYRWGYLDANYSFYTAWSIFTDSPLNEVPLYAVPNDPSLLAGFPAHKVSLNGHVTIWKGLSLNPSGSFLSRRYGQWSGDGEGNGLGDLGPALYLLNLYVVYNNLGVKGLDLGAGIYDLLNETYVYLQPYQSGHAPLPGPSREILARLAYALPF